MLRLKDRNIYLGIGITDMRKAINGLSLLVETQLEQELFSGDLFAFCNRSRSLVKILYWDRNGFCLWQKRLEKERFKWPESDKDMAEISENELEWLLEGLDISQAHKRLEYTTVF
jgi:transposase